MNRQTGAYSVMMVALLVAAGCGDAMTGQGEVVDAVGRPSIDGKADGLSAARAVRRALPSLEGSAVLPWGGPKVAEHRPEAIFANGVSGALNRSRAADDVRVAVPAQLHGSELRPYGDGQTNASMSFGGWPHPRPPLLATRVVHGQEVRVELRLDRELPYGGVDVQIEDSDGEVFTLQGQRDGEGDLVVGWELQPWDSWRWRPEEVLVVRPVGWADGFAVHFYLPTAEASELVGSMPPHLRDFGQGRALPDPAGVAPAAIAQGDGLGVLFEADLGPGYNDAPFASAHAHGDHPHDGGNTAVASTFAWVAQPPSVPVKHVYFCAEGRRPDLEFDHLVPSGAGWHEIGDPAETVLNTLTDRPLLVAHASDRPTAHTLHGHKSLAWSLEDVAVAGWLAPGEAFVTSNGTGPFAGRPAFHWYVYDEAHQPVCLELLVHPCAPKSPGDFACN